MPRANSAEYTVIFNVRTDVEKNVQLFDSSIADCYTETAFCSPAPPCRQILWYCMRAEPHDPGRLLNVTHPTAPPSPPFHGGPHHHSRCADTKKGSKPARKETTQIPLLESRNSSVNTTRVWQRLRTGWNPTVLPSASHHSPTYAPARITTTCSTPK